MKVITLIISALVLFSCGNSSADETTGTAPAPILQATTTPVNTSITADTAKQPVVITPTTTTSTTPIVKAPTGRLNPAHGQPGHRCDIAVGASLDAAPASPVVSTTNTGQTINPTTVTPTITPTVTPTAASVAKGMNPAHGQPGHRCDIAVGAPLDSKPVTQPAVTSTQAPVVESDKLKATPVVTPTVKTEPVVTAPGMNPPHGEPGHRCDISVGAPLNSAPIKKN